MGNNKVIFGQEYSAIYDSVHEEKNYLAEAVQIANLLTKTVGTESKILDFGCGTGKHVSKLADSGFVISGYDVNSNMIELAKVNFPDLNFFSDLSSVPKSFNFIYSLFDVLSYQVTDFEVSGFLQQINSNNK